MEFGEYYRGHFKEDFERLTQSVSSERLHHNHDENIPLIQPSYLQRRRVHLRTVKAENRNHFIVSLFFNVLVDQVCYTYYQPLYRQFQSLTRYPKLVGECPGGCGYHRHPIDAFMMISDSFGRTEGRNSADDAIYLSFEQSIGIMKDEVYDFLAKHMTLVAPSEFWQRCVNEFPLNI